MYAKTTQNSLHIQISSIACQDINTNVLENPLKKDLDPDPILCLILDLDPDPILALKKGSRSQIRSSVPILLSDAGIST